MFAAYFFLSNDNCNCLGQVLSGVSLGVGLSIYAEYSPQYMIVLDFVVQALIGIIALPIDSELDYRRGDGNNIIQWFLWGVALNIFSTGLVVRFFHRRQWNGFRSRLSVAMNELRPVAGLESVPLLSDDP